MIRHHTVTLVTLLPRSRADLVSWAMMPAIVQRNVTVAGKGSQSVKTLYLHYIIDDCLIIVSRREIRTFVCKVNI